jgi:asparagine synthase (glutamine-hydrolysing)
VHDLVGGEVWESGCAGLETAASHASMGAPGSDVPADGDLFNWISRAEMQGYMHNQLLRDTDAMSMAHSLEVRVPLLDRRLVETVLRLPGDLKVGGGHPKWLLSAAVADALPPAVTQRRDKRGFTFPFDVWLRGPLRPKTNELIDDAGTKPWVCRDSVQRVWRDFQNRKISWTRPWAIAVLAGASEHMA